MRAALTGLDISKVELRHLTVPEPVIRQAELIIFYRGPYCKVLKSRYTESGVVYNLKKVESLVYQYVSMERRSAKVPFPDPTDNHGTPDADNGV